MTESDIQANLEVVEFAPAEAPRLAAFHRRIEDEIGNPQVFEARDEAFFAHHSEAGGWIVGHVMGVEIVSVVVLWGDLSSFQESWCIPYEQSLLSLPAAWWGGWAIDPRFRGTDLGDALYDAAVRSLRDRGFSSLIGAFSPLSFAAHARQLNSGRCRIIGIYNDRHGWNYLRSEVMRRPIPHRAAQVELWIPNSNEAQTIEALGCGMVGITSRRNSAGFDVGFAPMNPKTNRFPRQ